MPTVVPNHASTRSSHNGQAKLPWISRRWKPTEWPSSSPAPVSANNNATAPGVTVSGPGDQRHQNRAAVPDRANRIPADMADDGVGGALVDEAVDGVRVVHRLGPLLQLSAGLIA